MHSFGMTEQYLLLVEFPLVVNPLQLLVSGKPFIENYHWKPERGTRFLVIAKQDGRVIHTAHSEVFFAFHHINAFERDGEVIVDLATIPDASIIDSFYLQKLTAPQATIPVSTLTRYTLPLNGAALTSTVVSATGIELPRINYERNNGGDYQFAYGVGYHEQHTDSLNRLYSDDWYDQLVKVDERTGIARTWYEDGCYPGEPVFVAAPGATGEDEGVVLSVVFDGKQGHSFLLVLDAASFAELARAQVSHHIPFGFHGIFTRTQ